MPTFASLLVCCVFATRSTAFTVQNPPQPTARLSMSSSSSSEGSSCAPGTELRDFVHDEFPAFASLLSMNPDVWKTLADAEQGATLFCPSDAVITALGDTKLSQLNDERNQETAQKMGLYHCVATEAVSAARLRTEDWTVPAPKDGSPRPINIQALVTLGGNVPVGRSKSGGFFLGLGAKEDGDIVIGPEARIVKSYKVAGSYVHEVDALISPVILWRYCDQLRIPGF